MDRRAFLNRLLATSITIACPAAIESVIASASAFDFQAYFQKWMDDTADVFVKCWEDQIIYGVSAYQHTKVYPYVERIDPLTLPAPIKRGGLFND